MKTEPVATYRVQLTPDFGFAQAAAIVPYLRQLGISHLYTSPSLQAEQGSQSGYDVVDPTRPNEELGGEAGHAALTRALEEAGMGRMLDIVPNHMSISSDRNPWWADVLEHGPSSPYAAFFDVDWEASEDRWPNRVLLPVLGDHFGRALEAGDFRLSHQGGRFTLHYLESSFPVEPSSLAEVLRPVAETCEHKLLAFIARGFDDLPRPKASFDREVARRHRDQAVLKDLLDRLCAEEPAIGEAIDAHLEKLNADTSRLGALIERQNYRLAFWRAADLDLGYRRFFNINDLAGLRVERPEVFYAVHALPLKWIREGAADALRVDHPDGLRDPAQYFRRLRESTPDAWIVIEKILQPGERLPADWPIEGTTGYDFANLLLGVLVDSDGEEAMNAAYRAFTRDERSFEEIAQEAKKEVLEDLLRSEVSRLASFLQQICERHWRHRDHTRDVLFEALIELAAAFPVYRTYAQPTGEKLADADRAYIDDAVAAAQEARPELDAELFDFLGRMLRLEMPGGPEEEFAVRFQQLTGPATAKGIEDTAFYRYHRLTALNEVGGEPGRFGLPLAAFHEACAEAQQTRPYSLLASSTHDTKRSEDVRARILQLAEMPRAWAEACARWHVLTIPQRCPELDRTTEYLVYQTLVGAWPIGAQRLTAYLEKAIREAKVHTRWTRQNEAYEKAVRRFAEGILTNADFVVDLEAFLQPLVAAGEVTSLAQTLVKLTAPGVPDIYQGCELWDLSLVDPDNRRPVDFERRGRLLRELEGLSPSQILERLEEGLPKLWVTRQALALRRELPECFGAAGAYTPLVAYGARGRHVLAFQRGEDVITLVPRYVLKLDGEWGDTAIDLPPGRWRNVLAPEPVYQDAVELGDLLQPFPVALLRKEPA